MCGWTTVSIKYQRFDCNDSSYYFKLYEMPEIDAEQLGGKPQASLEFNLEEKHIQTLLTQALAAREKAYCRL